LGDDVVFIHKWPWEGGFDYPWWKYMLRPQPEIEEMDDVIKRSELAESVSYRTVTNRSVKYMNNTIPSAEINGVGDRYEKNQHH
jgi:putative ABC transport system permease protein